MNNKIMNASDFVICCTRKNATSHGNDCSRNDVENLCEAAHGQIETREFFQTEDVKWLPQLKDWKGLKSIGMEHKTIDRKGEVIHEYRYFMNPERVDSTFMRFS